MTDDLKKNLSEIQAQWLTVRGRIRQKIGDAQFASWIKMLTLEDYEDRKVILSAPSNFIRTRIIEQYLDIIKSYWLVQNLTINDIQIIVSKKVKNPAVEIKTNETAKFKEQNNKDVFRSISSDLDSRFTFGNFIVGKPNELAFAAARRVAESKDVPFNPLLYGGVGLGKTHLMHAIAHEIKKEIL